MLKRENQLSKLPAEITYTAHTGCMDTEEISIEAIEEECGFCDVSAFHKVFKEQKNTTPAKYRKGK